MVLPGLLLWFTLLPSASSSRWCRLCLAACQSWRLLEEFHLLRAFVALFAPGNLDFAFALLSFSPSCVWVLPVEYAVFSGRVRCLVPQWIHVPREALDEFQHFLRCGELES